MQFSRYSLVETIKQRSPVFTSRAWDPEQDRPVILKVLQRSAMTPETTKALRREFKLLQDIDSPLVVKAIDLAWDEDCPALVLQDMGGQVLSALLADRRPPMAEGLRLGIAIARALEAVHDADIMHGDINPHNIIVSDYPDKVVLIDFGFAEKGGLPPRERAELRGSPDYIAPEMTGRLSQGADHRSDLFSLGVVIYEILSGHLPFPAGDLLQKVYAHLALQPRPLQDFLPTAPAVLGDVLFRLLAKHPQQRYQTATGLIRDLELCLAQVEGAPDLTDFKIGAADIPRKLILSGAVQGRVAETTLLREAFEAVSAGTPPGQVIEIAGPSGVGKSSLVNAFLPDVVQAGGLFVICNADTSATGDPMGGPLDAARKLAEILLTERYGSLDDWQARLRQGLGETLPVLAGLGPEFAALTGSTAAATALEPRENAERLGLVLRRFFRLCATARHPLVLVVEDIHAADPGVIAILEGLVRNFGCERLLLLVTRREDDAGETPRLTCDQTLTLGALDPAAVAAMLATTFHQTPQDTQPLAAAIIDKVGGTPLAVGQFLGALADDRSVRFDPGQGRWVWDLDAVRARDAGEDVVDLLISRGAGLTPQARQAIATAACIGRSFAIGDVEAGAALDSDGVSDALERAITMGWLAQVPDAPTPSLRFTHDRILRAARDMLTGQERRAVEARLADRLLSQDPRSLEAEKLFAAARHLAKALGPDADPDETARARQINAAAGKAALDTGDLQRAHAHFRTAVDLLTPAIWEADPGQALDITGGAAAAAMLVGAFDEAETRFETFLTHCPDPVGRAGILALRIFALVGQNKAQAAVEVGIAALADLGDPLPFPPAPADIEAEVGGIFAALAGRRIEDLAALPDVEDPAKAAVQQILGALLLPAFSGNPMVFAAAAARLAARSAADGLTEHSVIGFNDFGLVACGPMNQVDLGYEFSKLAQHLTETRELARLAPRVDTIFNAFIRHRKDPIRDTVPGLQVSRDDGIACGDINMAALSAFDRAFQIFWIGERLDLAEDAFAAAAAFCDDLNVGIMPDLIGLYRETIGALKSAPAQPGLLSGPFADGAALLDTYRQRQDANGLSQLHIAQMLLAQLYGDRDTALAEGRLAAPALAGITSTPAQPAFYALFAMIAVPAGEDAVLDPEDRAVLEQGAALTGYWAEAAPMNYRHFDLIVQAELALADGDEGKWFEAMEAAADEAAQQSFTRDAAMILERIAEVNLGRNRRRRYAHFIRDAWRAWVHYGADAKIAAISEQHGAAIGQIANHRDAEDDSLSMSLKDTQLDLDALLNATRAISQEVEISDLLRALLTGLTETAGANKTLVLAPHGNDFHIAAELEATEAGPAFVGAPDIDSSRVCKPAHAPLSALRLVLRTQRALSSSDVATDTRLSTDPFFADNAPKSLAILPLVHGGDMLGLVYLENREVADAFSGVRMKLLNALCAQAAISWHNAVLYGRQSRLLDAARRFVPAELSRLFARESIVDVKLTDARTSRMTLLVSDLRGSTTTAEKLGPKETFLQINKFLAGFSHTIQEHGGFVLKYVGDGLLALFPGGVAPAMDAAVAYQRSLDAQEWDPTAGGTLVAGVAIHSGEVMIGVIGDDSRMQIDALSDAVNVAFRLETLTKRFGARVLISDEALNNLGTEGAASHRCRYLGEVETQGRQSRARIHEVIDADPDQVREAKSSTLEQFEDGVRMFEKSDWVNACVKLSSVLRDNPGDAAAAGLFQEAARRMSTGGST